MTEEQTSQTGKRRSGKKYIRTFMFSMRVGAPLNRIHFITKVVGVLLFSFIVIKAMDEHKPDPILIGFFFFLSIILILLGGVSRWVFRSYMVLIFPMFLFLFLTWVAFTPNPGTQVYFQYPLYSGTINIGISIASAAFIFIAIIHYYLTKKVMLGILIGFAAALLIQGFTSNPGLTLASYSFLKPYVFIFSDKNALIAATKVFGYAAMVFNTLMLVMTTRDNELTSAFFQLRVPKLARFFLSIVFRTLNITLLDFETIRQAQIARGVRVRERNIFGLLMNTARMAIPLVATMLKRSNEIGDALLARGFTFERAGNEFLEVRALKFLDWFLIFVVIGYTLIYFLYPHNLFTSLMVIFK